MGIILWFYVESFLDKQNKILVPFRKESVSGTFTEAESTFIGTIFIKDFLDFHKMMYNTCKWFT